jgi:hypothetical protein
MKVSVATYPLLACSNKASDHTPEITSGWSKEAAIGRTQKATVTTFGMWIVVE